MLPKYYCLPVGDKYVLCTETHYFTGEAVGVPLWEQIPKNNHLSSKALERAFSSRDGLEVYAERKGFILTDEKHPLLEK